MPAENSIRTCAHCGADISHKTQRAKYCSDSCRNRGRIRDTKEKEWYERNKEEQRRKARARMAVYRNTEEGNRKRKAYAKKYQPEYRRRTDVLQKERIRNRNRNPPKFDAHVKDWNTLQNIKHDAHVKHMIGASVSWYARYWKSRGEPWRNPKLSDSVKYKIRYRLDLAFKLKEINRQTWRKEELAARNDGTCNFWELLKERKTCPYCGDKITKDNAVADHMDPIKHGGANGQHNLTICCRSCNTRKSGRPFVEWLDMLPDDRRSAALRWYKRKHGHGPEQSSLCFTFAA